MFTNEPTKIVAKRKLLSEQKMDKKVPGGLREKSCLLYLYFVHLDLLSSKPVHKKLSQLLRPIAFVPPYESISNHPIPEPWESWRGVCEVSRV